MAGAAVILLAALPGELGADAGGLLATAATQSAAVEASCASPRTDLRFEMLAPTAEAAPPAGRGLQVCLAVYRLERP